VASNQNIGQQLVKQLFNQPPVLILAAVIIAMMGLIPGMPHFAFLFLAAAMGGLAYYLINKPAVEEEVAAVDTSNMPVVEAAEASWEDVSQVDVLGLEVAIA